MRVVVQRKSPAGTWRVTGKLAKVAGKGYIVTNISRSNGNVMYMKQAIRKSSLNAGSSRKRVKKVKRTALQCAKHLSQLYPGHRIFGLDMGFDQKGRVWIIEANLNPLMSHFKKLGDTRMYRRILSYKKIKGAA